MKRKGSMMGGSDIANSQNQGQSDRPRSGQNYSQNIKQKGKRKNSAEIGSMKSFDMDSDGNPKMKKPMPQKGKRKNSADMGSVQSFDKKSEYNPKRRKQSQIMMQSAPSSSSCCCLLM